MTSKIRLLLPLLSLCLAFVTTFAARVAHAQDTAKVALVVDGDDALALKLIETLPPAWEQVDPRAFAKASKTELVGSPKALDAPKTRAKYIERLLRAANDVHADAAVVVRVTTVKKSRVAKVLVFVPNNKKPVGTHSVGGATAAGVQAAIAPELAQIAGPNRAAAAPRADAKPTPPPTTTPPPASTPPETKPTETKPEKEATKEAEASKDADKEKDKGKDKEKDKDAATASKAADASLPLLDAYLGLDFGSRHFSYNDAITANLRPYDVDFVPSPAVKLELYPLAKTSMAFLRDIGLVGGLHASPGLKSQAPNGDKISTTWSRVDIGARVRFRLGSKPVPPVLGFNLGYGRETFSFPDQGLRVQNELPSVAYELFRIGLDTRVPVGPVAIYGNLSGLPVLHSGDIGKRIRGQTVGGVEAEAGVAWPFTSHFEARFAVDYRRFFFSFKPEPGDAIVAGGALDQIVRIELGLAFVY